MLEYINDINVKTKINEKNMCNVLYISTKYGLPKLIELSTKIVKSSLNKSNIFELFCYAIDLNDENLNELLWKWLGRKSLKITEPIINQIFKSFKTGKEISILLQKDYISIHEERIFIHCLNWLKSQYQNPSKSKLKSISSLSAREICSDFIQFIRFPLMSNKFLSIDVYNTGILTNDELLDIMRAKTLKNQNITPYNLNKRKVFLSSSTDKDGDDDDSDSEEEKLDESDNDFDSVNLENSDNDTDDENEDDDENEIEITKKVRAIGCSSQYGGGYSMENVFAENTNYWCTTSLQSNIDAYIIFDCGKYIISKIGIKFPPGEGACSICRVYTTDNKRNLRNVKLKQWDKITKKVNMSKSGTTIENIKIRNEDISRYILLNLEDGMNGYAGIERIRFYSIKND